MKLTQSLIAIAALGTLTSTLSFAGGDINPITVFEQEPVFVPIEVVPVPAPVFVPAPAPAPAPVVVVAAPKVVAPPTVVAPKKTEPLGFYVAGALGSIAARSTNENWANVFTKLNNQDRQAAYTGRFGYDFMNYLGAELRGTVGFASIGDGYDRFIQYGAYLKPNYNVTDDLNLYGLVGASKSNLAGISHYKTGLSYGAGLDYDVGNNISVFTDMVNYMHKADVPEAWGVSVGAAYNF